MTRRPTALEASALYVALTLVMTWPLATDLARSLPGDFGDSLLNSYLLAWGEKHLVAFLGGDPGAFSSWWQVNIFHPAPDALAYSEHLFTEIVLALPVWLATHNVILAYNVVFLTSIALSGIGMFLLVRDLTGSARAALLAGLCFAFLPYRFAQVPHVQVMSSEWMPWTIYGLRRYVTDRRPRAFAGALAALVAQQLACGYFLLYFTPFVVLYLAWELTARRLWGDRTLLTSLAALVVVDSVVVWPFLGPYLALRRLGFPPRPLAEVAKFAADVLGYFTAAANSHFWGRWVGMTPWPRAENELFPGAVLSCAAALACAMYIVGRRRGGSTGSSNSTGAADLRPWAVLVVIVAWSLSLGPVARIHGHVLDSHAPYRYLYDYVPGFDGLRVPARLGMLVCLGLAVLSGYGFAVLEGARRATLWTACLSLVILAESTVVPLELNGNWTEPGVMEPRGLVLPESHAPEVYRRLAGMPPGTVVVEFPFGYRSWELRYVFYASVHEQRLLNGYSGGFPASYLRNIQLLHQPLARPDEAWRCLIANGVTTAVVHRDAYRGDEADALIGWLLSHGARRTATAREAEVLQVPAFR